MPCGGRRRTGWRVRVAGSGHSFTPLVATDGLLLHVDGLSGVLGVDRERRRVRVLAGTPLHVLNPALQALGLALPNLGDIDRQTISGAIATGTHGTGTRRQGIAAAVSGLTLVLADGSTLECSAEVEPEVFAAAAGRARRARGRDRGRAAVRAGLPAARQGGRAPRSPSCCRSSSEEADATRPPRPASGSRTPTGCSPSATTSSGRRGSAAAGRRGARAWTTTCSPTGCSRSLNRLGAARPAARARDQPAQRAGDRHPGVRRRLVEGVLLRARRCASSRASTPCRGTTSRRCSPSCGPGSPAPAHRCRSRWRCASPRGDDVWLSTAYERDNAYVAVHQYHRMDPRPLFAAFEAIVAEHEGRPHWGKVHTLGAERLRELYPRFDDFRAVRERLDPGHLFTNDHVAHLLDG